MPHLKSGKIKAIGVGGDSRRSILLQLPNFAEQGIAGYNVKNWFGIVAPARTQNVILHKLVDVIAKIQVQP